MSKKMISAILLSITYLLTSCAPAPLEVPNNSVSSASVLSQFIPVGERELRQLESTTETIRNCGRGGGTIVKHPYMSTITGHAVEWEVGGTTGVGVLIGEGVIPGGVNFSVALEGRYVTQFDQSVQQGTSWDLPAEPNTIVVYTIAWHETWQPGYVEVRQSNQSVIPVNLRYRTGIQSEVVDKQVQVCDGEQQPVEAVQDVEQQPEPPPAPAQPVEAVQDVAQQSEPPPAPAQPPIRQSADRECPCSGVGPSIIEAWGPQDKDYLVRIEASQTYEWGGRGHVFDLSSQQELDNTWVWKVPEHQKIYPTGEEGVIPPEMVIGNKP